MLSNLCFYKKAVLVDFLIGTLSALSVKFLGSVRFLGSVKFSESFVNFLKISCNSLICFLE